MKPLLRNLSLVSIKKSETYKTNDIISLKTLDNKYHVHRIMEINEKEVSTKGDNLDQQWYEKNVPIERIEGLLTWHFP